MREKIPFCERENLKLVREQKKIYVKVQTVREISEISTREKRLWHLKKWKSGRKKLFHTYFFFHVEKKALLVVPLLQQKYDSYLHNLNLNYSKNSIRKTALSDFWNGTNKKKLAE